MIITRAAPLPAIESIEAVTLDKVTLKMAHFISESCFLVVAALTDIPEEDLATGRVSCVEVLREHLP